MAYTENRTEVLKRKYPSGTKIMLDLMGKDPRPVPPGTKGIVLFVDDIGTVHCAFENGRQLGLIPGEDFFHRLQPPERTGDRQIWR